jgi:type I restriction enzyme, S subunit
MNVEQFFEKFELLAEAPNAVAKMRELVLDLAVQGKLVEPQASEGDGHALLKRLRTLPPERNSKSRSPKDLPFEPDARLDIPFHWAITTIENTTRDTGFFCDGDWVESKDQDPNGEVRLIQLADVGDGKYRDRSSRFMTTEAAKRLNCSYLESGDILVARMPDPLGRCCRFPGDSKPAVTVVDVCILRPNVAFFDPDFIVVAINSPRFRRLVLDQATGTTRSRISRSNLGMLPIPLPPLAEQKRIVAKVDELMALCDQLEAQQQEREEKKADLARASLARFAEAPTPANLGFIFHKSYDITPADLRKSILTLAVQGKLVPQDPNDEPAVELLDRIVPATSAENRRRQADALATISVGSQLYELPESWAWARFRDVAIIASNLVKPNEFQDFVHLAPDNIEKGNGVLLACTTVREDKVISANHRFYPGQIIYSKIRPNLAKVVVVDFEGLCSADMYPINALIDVNYLHRYMLSEPFLAQAVKADTRVAMPKINQVELNAIAVPIPPLAEQRRIVAKVDQLMTLVDQLEAQLSASCATAANLLQAILKDAFAPALSEG